MEKRLTVRDDGSFKILQLTDMHYTHDDDKDRRAVALAESLIREEDPDLIMITGDLVFGPDSLHNLDKALAPVVRSGKPWSFVFGNHDVEFASNRKAFFAELQKRPGCVAYHDEESVDGMGNHVLEIRSREGALCWLIFGLDSGDYNPMTAVGGYGYITENQIAWYRKQMRRYHDAHPDFSALAFQHMPLPEHQEVWDYSRCYGLQREEICCPRINTGLFYAMLREGHMKGLFVGHDHINDYWGEHFGIALGFGRYSGYNSYGPEDFLRGGRLFLLKDSDPHHFETYLRLEDHRRILEDYVHEPAKSR